MGKRLFGAARGAAARVIGAAALAAAASGQTTVNGGRIFLGQVAAARAAATQPARKGSGAPAASCTQGEIYFRTDATAGQNLYFCTAANAWTQMTATGSGGAEVSGLRLLSQSAYYGPIFRLYPPNDAEWSWVNQGGATVNVAEGGIFLKAPANGARLFRIREKALPAAPYEVTLGYIPLFSGAQFAEVAVGWRASSSGKLILADMLWSNVNGSSEFGVFKFSTPAVYEGAYGVAGSVNVVPFAGSGIRFVKLKDDGTNRSVWISNDGVNFLVLPQSVASRTDYVTPDRVVFAVSSGSTTHDAGVTLVSYQEH